MLPYFFINCADNSSKTNSDIGKPPVSLSTSAWDAPTGALVEGATLTEGWEDLRELPAPINLIGGWTDSAHIAATGTSLYFAYSKVDAFKFISSNGNVKEFSGTARTGMLGDEFRIFRADLSTTGWIVNYHPVNDPTVAYATASMSTNQSEDLIVFTRWRLSPKSDGNLFFAIRTGNVWSTPSEIPVNSLCEDDNAFVVGSLSEGVDLYFESNRMDAAGTTCGGPHRIYYSKYTPDSAGGGSFSPVIAAPGLNSTYSDESDTQPSISIDKRSAYWTTLRKSPPLYGIVTADFSNGTWSNMRPIVFPNTTQPPFTNKLAWIGEANVAEVKEGWLLYMMCGIATGDLNGKPDKVQLRVCRARKRK